MTTRPPGPADPAPSPQPAYRWPDGYRAAAALTFDLDAESAVLAIDPSSAGRLSVMSHQRYGPLVGTPRLLELLRRHDVRATFFVPGFTAERYPDVVRRILDGGHEIAHHGYLHESAAGLDARQEKALIERGLEALDRVAGIRPVGYRAPFWETNDHTPRLLADLGFDYDSSLMDDDVPYLLDPGGGRRPLVEIPVHWGLDDWEQYAYLPGITGAGVIESPRKAYEMWHLELEAMHAEGGCFVLTLHPFLSGRPGRARVVDELLGTMRTLPGLWIPTLAEIAAQARSEGAGRPRPITPIAP